MGPGLLALVTAFGPCHPMPDSAVLLRFRERSIEARLILPIVELRLGWQKPVPMDAVAAVERYGKELVPYVLEHVHAAAPDGRAWTVAVRGVYPVVEEIPDLRVELVLTPPQGAPVDHLLLRYDVIFHQLVTHKAVVAIASDWRRGVVGDKPLELAVLRDTSPMLEIDRSQGSWTKGFATLFGLGTEHIADGLDHVLFLLMLLWTAPSIARGRRWEAGSGAGSAIRRILVLVTAFTVGHSVTLALGAFGWQPLPVRLVESAIALSILAAALHACVPVLGNHDGFVVAAFGLLHGMAFAETLAGYGLERGELALGLLAFNLGIEAFQVFLVLLTFPWILLLARSRLHAPLRIGIAIATGIAALSWLVERATGWVSPLASGLAAIPAYGGPLLAALAVLALGAFGLEAARRPA